MKRLILLLLLLIAPYSLLTAAEENSSSQARSLLEKMTTASRKLNYDGVFVYDRDQQLDSMRIIHKVDERGEVERLISLTGSNREVIRNKQDVTCIYSDNRTVMVDKGGESSKFLLSNLPESIARISDFYDFNLLGEDRVVGRSAQIVEIMPKDENRYIYRLWIDNESSLILKSVVTDIQQKVLETVMFTQIEIGSDIPNSLVKPMNASNYSWYTNESKPNSEKLVETEWQVNWLPKGFKIESTKVQVLSQNKQTVEHLVYSDGLATVSLFIEAKNKDDKTKPMTGSVSLGAVNAYTLYNDNYQVTVVGELPAKTVYKIASFVRHNRSTK